MLQSLNQSEEDIPVHVAGNIISGGKAGRVSPKRTSLCIGPETFSAMIAPSGVRLAIFAYDYNEVVYGVNGG